MKPIPVSFHVGPLEIHTYGIGLAITFYFAYRYFDWRLRKNDFPSDWLVGVFLWVILAAIAGARALHVLSNLTFYVHNPGDVFAIWHGGLSSFGGILFAVPVGLYLARRRCLELTTGRALDLVAPVLMAAWAMGRLLGPQLMVAGGGHPTHQWFGLYYAGQVGRRLPVPIFQAIEDFAVFLVLIWIERRLDHWPDGSARTGYPTGIVLGTGMVLWGIERFADEHLWLGEDGRLGSILVQIAGIALAVGGIAVLLRSQGRWRQWLRNDAPGVRDHAQSASPHDAAGPPDAPVLLDTPAPPDPTSGQLPSDEAQALAALPRADPPAASGDDADTGSATHQSPRHAAPGG